MSGFWDFSWEWWERVIFLFCKVWGRMCVIFEGLFEYFGGGYLEEEVDIVESRENYEFWIYS